MQNIKLDYGDYLVCDPCYIKSVKCGGEYRFDALRCERVLHDGDDGEYRIVGQNGDDAYLGVDSGRIWVMQAEFGVEVEMDAGLSGFMVFAASAENARTIERLHVESNNIDYGDEDYDD